MAWRPVERLQTGPATPLAAHIASLTVGGTDRVDLNIAALNSHDGTSAFRILVTPVPVVCANTQSAALSNHESSFLYVYVDILHLYLPGVVPDILEGRVWELDINQAWAFGALALMAIPISMIGLSMALPARSNRRANLAVAVVYVVVSVFNAVGESWTYYFGFAVGLEVLVLAAIIRCAWTWPKTIPATVDQTRTRAHA